jgi:UDP-N-acetylglucosamine transferase subunit ALG13
MIFVTVGTNEARFDRLLHAFEWGPLDEELVVQHGPSPIRPRGATCVDYLPYDELGATVRRARVVVTHAGVGSIMTALANGKRPVVVPRLRRFGEAVDDHQMQLGLRLHATEDDTHVVELGPDRRLVTELRDFVTAHSRR